MINKRKLKGTDRSDVNVTGDGNGRHTLETKKAQAVEAEPSTEERKPEGVSTARKSNVSLRSRRK